MALTASQICQQARSIARAPGFTTANGAAVSSGDLLQYVLDDLCQTYDLALALQTTTITLNATVGSGPYQLPTDYLRMAQNEVIYQVFGTPYTMINVALWEFDQLVQNAGINTYPENFATDPSQTPPVIYVWPPPSMTFVPQIRYFRLMPAIVTPEVSAIPPWFPNTSYLVSRVAGELMKLTNDPRQTAYLGDGPDGAQGILRRYLELQADDEGRAQTVQLDRRRFGYNWDRLPNTKTTGWLVTFGVCSSVVTKGLEYWTHFFGLSFSIF